MRRGLLVVLATLVIAPAADGSSAQLIATNCQPVWVGASSMIYNHRQANGLWDAYIGDGCKGQPLLPAYAGHRGASDATPDGRFVLLETDMGSPLGQAMAEPGKGIGDQIQLLDRDTGRLTDLTTGRKGTIWARIKPDGSKVVWSQFVQSGWDAGDVWNYLLGIWEIHVADITPDGHLANEHSFSMGKGFYETYGWTGDRLMFASDATITPRNPWGAWLDAQDWTISETLDPQSLRMESRQFPTWWGGKEWDYHEFMVATTDGFLTSVLRDANGGMDLWKLTPTGYQRVTFFNGQVGADWQYHQVPGWPVPHYAVVGGVVPSGTKLYVGVAQDQNAKAIDAYLVTP